MAELGDQTWGGIGEVELLVEPEVGDDGEPETDSEVESEGKSKIRLKAEL